jgi:hypothetical protein
MQAGTRELLISIENVGSCYLASPWIIGALNVLKNSIASIGRLIIWENDRSYLTRLLVKVRVIELHEVPHFIVISKADGFQDHSLTIQCEILKHNMLGGEPTGDDEAPQQN